MQALLLRTFSLGLIDKVGVFKEAAGHLVLFFAVSLLQLLMQTCWLRDVIVVSVLNLYFSVYILLLDYIASL